MRLQQSAIGSHRLCDHHANDYDGGDAGSAGTEDGSRPSRAAEHNAGVGFRFLEFHERPLGMDAGALGIAPAAWGYLGAGALGPESRRQDMGLDSGILAVGLKAQPSPLPSPIRWERKKLFQRLEEDKLANDEADQNCCILTR
jgi:hypothetical protein